MLSLSCAIASSAIIADGAVEFVMSVTAIIRMQDFKEDDEIPVISGKEEKESWKNSSHRLRRLAP